MFHPLNEAQDRRNPSSTSLAIAINSSTSPSGLPVVIQGQDKWHMNSWWPVEATAMPPRRRHRHRAPETCTCLPGSCGNGSSCNVAAWLMLLLLLLPRTTTSASAAATAVALMIVDYMYTLLLPCARVSQVLQQLQQPHPLRVSIALYRLFSSAEFPVKITYTVIDYFIE